MHVPHIRHQARAPENLPGLILSASIASRVDEAASGLRRQPPDLRGGGRRTSVVCTFYPVTSWPAPLG